MKEITATYFARNLSDVMDEVERTGEAFRVTRGGKAIVEVSRAKRGTGAELKRLLLEYPPDPEWLEEILATRRLLYTEEREWPESSSTRRSS